MASSGVTVNDAVVTEFVNLKLRHQYRYIILKLSDDLKQVVVEKTVESKGKDCKTLYEEFVAELPEKDCRYAVFDMEYQIKDGVSTRDASSVVFIVWCPDTAKVKTKMLYASSKVDLKKKLDGISVEIQGADIASLDLSEVEEKCKKKH